MRNWNHNERNTGCRVYAASRLPMRNWNRPTRSRWHNHQIASRLPMRNWNSSLASITSPGSVELPDYLWGIETGYLQSDSVEWIWRFQTTYEELKLCPGSMIFSLIPSASRLPMRNWNLPVYPIPAYSPGLPDYLWGIETCWLCSQDPKASMLPDYLWGIETLLDRFGNLHDALASRLPMRNWNFLQNGNIHQIRLPSFQTTYEELKPRSPMRLNRFFWLPDYLWGIETSLVEIPANIPVK